tara:strand:- start:415 stop:1203 length:789 start_codon:yes stop_codon:yes gene_type:complete
MKSYVITIKGMKPSEEASQKCITSGAKHNVDVTLFDAYTPKDKPFDVFKEEEGVICRGRIFKDTHNPQAALGCLLSHYMLWKKCVETNEITLITEHDAIFVSEVPDIIKNGEFSGLVNLAKPGYGRMQSISSGLGPLRSKGHFPGTHGYAVKPEAAAKMIEFSKRNGIHQPADRFLDSKFRFIQEYAPWPIESAATFTSIQYFAKDMSVKTSDLPVAEKVGDNGFVMRTCKQILDPDTGKEIHNKEFIDDRGCAIKQYVKDE